MFGGNESKSAFPITNNLVLDASTDNLIQKFWNVKLYGTKPKDNINVTTVNDKRAMDILQKAITNYENHYAAGLLWKKGKVLLLNKKPLGLSRLYNLENKFGKNQTIN